MKMRQRGGRCGDSIVEVMVSTVIFLMLMAVLQGAMMFSNSAQNKSRQIRQDIAKIYRELQKSTAEGTEVGTYEFYASSADGTVIGNEVFLISALKQRKTVTYTDADGEPSQVTFYLFGTDGGVSP